MKLLVILLLILPLPVIAASPVDTRPLVEFPYMQSDFSDQGLWFWSEDPRERTSSSVEYINGGDDTSPTRRTLFCVGQLGAKVAIFCVSVTNPKDVDLLLLGFLKGYKAGQRKGL